MRIVHFASEFAPIAKAGGLGEVLVGLVREHTLSGHDVEVILPKYKFISDSKLSNLKLEFENFNYLNNKNSAFNASAEGCKLTLLKPGGEDFFFERDQIYGYPDDASRFLYFSRLALEYLKLKNRPIDILHLHDWHVSIAAFLAKYIFKNLKIGAVCLTIHNMEYQGKCSPFELNQIGDAKELLLSTQKEGSGEEINLLKEGLIHSDAIIPVSLSYAKEILTPEYGYELDAILRAHKTKIQGVLNGIDAKLWNPEKDSLLDLPYTVESVAKAKIHYKNKFKPPTQFTPWVGAITRLVPQKGPELLEEALHTVLSLNGTFLLLGSSPIPEVQERFEKIKKKYASHPQVYLHYEYNEALAHNLYAALDFLLVPSKFEPCGLTQLIAMTYGAIPIVRATGGLKDTVFDYEDPKTPVQKRNGFLFEEFTKEAMNQTLKRALSLYQKDPASYHSLVRRGMQDDFSWKNPAKKYRQIYQKLLFG